MEKIEDYDRLAYHFDSNLTHIDYITYNCILIHEEYCISDDYYNLEGSGYGGGVKTGCGDTKGYG